MGIFKQFKEMASFIETSENAYRDGYYTSSVARSYAEKAYKKVNLIEKYNLYQTATAIQIYDTTRYIQEHLENIMSDLIKMEAEKEPNTPTPTEVDFGHF